MRWVAYISFKGRKKTLGVFKTMEEAVEARKRAEEELYETFLEEYYAGHPEEEHAASPTAPLTAPQTAPLTTTPPTAHEDGETSSGEESTTSCVEQSSVENKERAEMYFSARPELAKAYEAWNARPPYLLAHTRMDVFDQKICSSVNNSHKLK